MRALLIACLVLSVVQSGLCCGKGRKGGKKGPLNPLQPQCTQPIPCLYGSNAKLSPYEGGDDTPGQCDQLKCNLDDKQSCCWNNAVPPTDEFNFVSGSGEGEAEKLQQNFGTGDSPNGNYFITASQGTGEAGRTAQLYSCPITCSQGDITVKARHWQTKGVSIQVCTETDPTGPPQNCQDLPGGSGKTDQVTIPKGENQRVVIQAKGFTSATGDVAIVDDIEVQCDPCLTTTTPAATTPTSPGQTTGPATTAPPAGKPPCKEIRCTFEEGNTCSYQPVSSGGNAAEGWGGKQSIYQNRLTGIPRPSPEGKKFAGCYTKKKGEKATMSTNAAFDGDYLIRYRYYKATEGLTLKVCCDDESNCPQQVEKSVQTADYRAWKQATITCKSGTKKVLFVCENTDGASEGACGVDDINLIKPCSGDPNTCSEAAC